MFALLPDKVHVWPAQSWTPKGISVTLLIRELIGSIITYVDILVSASLPITHVSWKQCVGSNLSRTPVSGYWGYDLRYVWFSTHSCFMKCGLLCLSCQTWHSWFTKQVRRSVFPFIRLNRMIWFSVILLNIIDTICEMYDTPHTRVSWTVVCCA